MNSYIRPVDLASLRGDSYQTQVLWAGESCEWTAASLGRGASGPPARSLDADIVYFVIAGALSVRLPGGWVTAAPETTVYVPAGMTHGIRNHGDDPVLHLEMRTPGFGVSANKGTGLPFVRDVNAVEVDPKVEIFDRRLLVTPSDGSENLLLYEATMKSGQGGMGLHIHESVDQFYYVLEGQLTCQVGIDELTIGPHTLAVLLRHVPHDPRNDSLLVERHLSAITPGAVPNMPRAHVPVTLTVPSE